MLGPPPVPLPPTHPSKREPTQMANSGAPVQTLTLSTAVARASANRLSLNSRGRSQPGTRSASRDDDLGLASVAWVTHCVIPAAPGSRNSPEAPTGIEPVYAALQAAA